MSKLIFVHFTPDELRELHFLLMGVVESAASDTDVLVSAYNKIADAKLRLRAPRK